MRFAILGSSRDGQCRRVAEAFVQRGAEPIILDSDAIHDGVPCSFDGTTFWYRGAPLDDVGGWYVRRILSPLPPAFTAEDEHHLFSDWLTDYMHRRERFGYLLSWLLAEQARGVPMLNPPEQGCGVQMKAYQLAAARSAGLEVPRTRITNDPEAVRAFEAEVGALVYKPSMGGDLCRPLDAGARERLHLIARHPVTFQERVDGTSIRATVVGDRVVSCVEIETGALDYRDDPTYRQGGQAYRETRLPEPVERQLFPFLSQVGLRFAGVDFIRTDDGRFVFLEANSSPIYEDVEAKTGHPISDAIAEWILVEANLRDRERSPVESFIPYASPYPPVERRPHEVSAADRSPVQ